MSDKHVVKTWQGDDLDLGEAAFNAMQVRAFNTAQAHGFNSATFGERIALVHSELSEALEDYREGLEPGHVWRTDEGKPCGIPSELADVVIRVLDLCENEGINLWKAIQEKMDFNDTRSMRHGGKIL